MFRTYGEVNKVMSIKTMKTRLNYHGGNAEGRMIKDKERSLKKALLYSYQAATAILEDGREFRCLINPNKNKPEYDNKILSIPFYDICLNKDRVGTTTQGQEEIGIKGGDVFTWKETNTKWLVYLRYIEEDAYFRSEIRRCDYIVKIGENEYPIYVRGPVETKINWNLKADTVWNTPNYTLTIMVTKNEETLAFFHRFQQVKVDGKNWEVQTVNDMDGDNVIEMTLSEYFTNKYADAAVEDAETPELEPVEPGTPLIVGEEKVYPYDVVSYTLENLNGGTWKITYPSNPNINPNKVAKILESSDSAVTIEIVTGKSNTFVLSYDTEQVSVEKTIVISSL